MVKQMPKKVEFKSKESDLKFTIMSSTFSRDVDRGKWTLRQIADDPDTAMGKGDVVILIWSAIFHICLTYVRKRFLWYVGREKIYKKKLQVCVTFSFFSNWKCHDYPVEYASDRMKTW